MRRGESMQFLLEHALRKMTLWQTGRSPFRVDVQRDVRAQSAETHRSASASSFRDI